MRGDYVAVPAGGRLRHAPRPAGAHRGSATASCTVLQRGARERPRPSGAAGWSPWSEPRRCRQVVPGAQLPVRGAEPVGDERSFGRCLSYGEGITFWPLADDRRAARRTCRRGRDRSLGRRRRGRAMDRRASRARGRIRARVPRSIEEIQLAMRRFLEAAARRRPLVVVVEDIHWAEPTLLDVLDHVASHAHDVPLPARLPDATRAARPSNSARPHARTASCARPAVGSASPNALLERLDPEAGARCRTSADGCSPRPRAIRSSSSSWWP